MQHRVIDEPRYPGVSRGTHRVDHEIVLTRVQRGRNHVHRLRARESGPQRGFVAEIGTHDAAYAVRPQPLFAVGAVRDGGDVDPLA